MISPLSIIASASSSVSSRISVASPLPLLVSFEDAVWISHQKSGIFLGFLADSAFGVLAFEFSGTDVDQAFMAASQKSGRASLTRERLGT